MCADIMNRIEESRETFSAVTAENVSLDSLFFILFFQAFMLQVLFRRGPDRIQAKR